MEAVRTPPRTVKETPIVPPHLVPFAKVSSKFGLAFKGLFGEERESRSSGLADLLAHFDLRIDTPLFILVQPGVALDPSTFRSKIYCLVRERELPLAVW